MANLKDQAINSLKWTSIQTAIIGLSAPLLLIIKARFLSPTEFAALAIVTIFIGLFKTLENFGISQAIIQKDEITKEESSSLFFINLLLALFLGLTLFILSPVIAIIFKMPELEHLLSITSLLIIINGPSLLFRAFLEKSLYFKELSLINLFSHLVMFVSTLIFLYHGMSVLGVVLGQIISMVVSVILIIIVSLRRKVCHLIFFFSILKIKPFFKFGAYVSVKQIMTYITHHLDELIIGYFFTPEILGGYHFAKSMLEKLRSLITATFSKVLFPLLSKLKNDQVKLTRAYMKITNYLAIFAIPVFIGIAVTAHLFVPVVFGEEWQGSVIFFQILSITLIFLVLTANVSTSLLYSVGKPDLVLYIDIIINSLYLVSLVLLAPLGVIPVLIVYSSYVILKTIMLQYQTSKYLLFSFFEYIISFKNVILVSLFMVGAVLLIQIITADVIGDLGSFILSVVIGIIVYLVGILLLEKSTLHEIKSAFSERIV